MFPFGVVINLIFLSKTQKAKSVMEKTDESTTLKLRTSIH